MDAHPSAKHAYFSFLSRPCPAPIQGLQGQWKLCEKSLQGLWLARCRLWLARCPSCQCSGPCSTWRSGDSPWRWIAGFADLVTVRLLPAPSGCTKESGGSLAGATEPW